MNALKALDPEIDSIVRDEEDYQRRTIRLIASENYVSQAVLEATGSVFTNKYSEGYPGARFYQGQVHVDRLERLAIERALALFGADHANVQPYSGSPANLAVYASCLQPGDAVLGLDLACGGHLTHGSPASVTGKWFRAFHYGVDRDTGLIDYDALLTRARECRPKLLIAGHSAYPRGLDFERFRAVADEVGALLLVDMSHFAGLVAGGVHDNPVPHADFVTTTTHKTLRGPRGAMILCRAERAKSIDRAVFPGLQGGPHNHTTAGIAVALREAAQPAFAAYARRVVENARAFAEGLLAEGVELVTGGTDNHLLLVDLTRTGVSGKPAAEALERAGIVANMNTIPGETRKPSDPSGLRLGTAAVTSRGFGLAEMKATAEWIGQVLRRPDDATLAARVAREVEALCASFPAPGLGD